MQESNIPKLEEITNDITSQFKHDIKEGVGNSLKAMTDFHDTQDMVIVVVAKEEDRFRTIHLNKYAREKMIRFGGNPDDFTDHCIGNHPNYNKCPMKSPCAAEKVWNKGQYVFERDVEGPISGEMYDVLLFPLKFNGTRAVVEFWIPQERDGCD